ncbi:hypothetical protein C8J42_103562 [Sphingomonas sp. PP-CE-1A-559]|uniref:hypothetical protein n=1 Tax=Sphingomonas sp. PP-CE-1A-559 TaxID=2135657 RepID=UPI001054B86C|nr:hypothetical protein [Sphingomonas sp. PP-CE-1A-559]TCP91870.1 hypothetical protein C8J42_103562 [Sphingomonas sp. PP-CE-1A-559]
MATPVNKAEGEATRALIRMLLETHTRADVFHMMQRTVSGTWVSLGVVKTIRREMIAAGARRCKTNIARPHLREEPAAPEPVAPVVEPALVVRRPALPPESFESQMARIAAGARLVPAPDFRTAGPSYTLGGVSSGICANAG